MNELLKGAYDMHVHTSPDILKRKCDDIELAQRFLSAAMGGCIIKGHFAETAGRARIIQKMFPELTVRGGIVMNNFCGGINPDAAECCGKLGGKYLWMPTLDAYAYRKLLNPTQDLRHTISLLNQNGTLKQEVLKVLDIAAEYHMLIGTGHVSAKEGLAVAKEAHRRGLTTILTHADNANCRYSIEEQKEAVQYGAIVEHSYYTVFYNETSVRQIIQEIRAVGYQHVILSTDFGQISSPYADEGLLKYAELLLSNGFNLNEIKYMIAELPEQLIKDT